MLTPEEQLRLLLGERVPKGGTEADTLFTTEELSVLLNNYDDSMDAAAAHGWAIKTAALADLIDISEEGSTRNLSQRFQHAQLMLDHYSRRVETTAEMLLEAARGAIVARSARWATPPSEELPSSSTAVEASPFDDGKAQYVRPYPLHRFRAIKN